METKVCAHCGNTYEYDPSLNRNRKYCSLSCQRKANANARNSQNPKRLSVYNCKGKIAPLVLERYGRRCAICGWQAYSGDVSTINGTRFKANGNEIHHIVSVKDGGLSEWNNLILLCPNHHKLANMGLISVEELSRHVLPQYTEAERENIRRKAISNSADRIANAIFGTTENTEETENANQT